jgi:hypothetical protein
MRFELSQYIEQDVKHQEEIIYHQANNLDEVLIPHPEIEFKDIVERYQQNKQQANDHQVGL